MTCTSFVFRFEDLSNEHVATPPFISFPPGLNAIGGLQSCILLCDSIRLCIRTLELKDAS